MQYARFQISPDELQSALDLIRELNFVGVNLTTPHKIAASKLMDEIDDNVRRIGAINTVKIDNAKLRGYNTDGKGFARAVRQEFAVDLRDLRVMILGAGGAARALPCNVLVKIASASSLPIALSPRHRNWRRNCENILPVPGSWVPSRGCRRFRGKKRPFDSKSHIST